MAGRTRKAPGSTVTTGLNNRSRALLEPSATSKNQAHPYFVAHQGLVSGATWTVKELCKAYERAIDEAVQVLFDGLRHPQMKQRLAAAAYFLRHTEAGRRRWGRGSS
jgi:hypothetical protein